MATKILSTVRLTPKTKRLLELLAQETGMTQTAVIEQAVRRMAKQEGIALQEQEGQEDGSE